ncbi:MAG TPA: hypothetical protein VGG04_08885 [Candidatus Sulfotelmatobacter sp.]|jgi:hypothetical protein
MIEGAVILSGVVRHWLDFFIILFLLISNAVVAFWEEHQAGNEIAALRGKLATKPCPQCCLSPWRSARACWHATSTRNAPWYSVPADDKVNTRLIVSRIVLDTLKDLKMAYPKITGKRRQELQAIGKDYRTKSNGKIVVSYFELGSVVRQRYRAEHCRRRRAWNRQGEKRPTRCGNKLWFNVNQPSTFLIPR